MSTSTFVPLNLGLIEEGTFLETVDGDFAMLQQKLIEFCTAHQEKADKATAKLTIEVEVKIADPKSKTFAIKAKTKTTMPSRPISATFGMGGETQDGRLAVMVQQTGSNEDSPRQGRLWGAAGADVGGQADL